jgi:hypothetical protein
MKEAECKSVNGCPLKYAIEIGIVVEREKCLVPKHLGILDILGIMPKITPMLISS